MANVGKCITVQFYSSPESRTFSGSNSYIAENVVLNSCKYLGIGPVARHLFSLWNPAESLWYAPNYEFDLIRGDSVNVFLRLRFRVPSIERLVANTDSATINYYYHQMRNEFIEGRIEELHTNQMRQDALGLVATDIIRVMLESKMTPDTMKINAKLFIPHMLRRHSVWDNFLQNPIMDAVNKGWHNCQNNPAYVKELYLRQLFTLIPDYGPEQYSVLVDDKGRVFQVDLVVNPYHKTQPGIRMKVQQRKHAWTYICAIEELCYVSMRSDLTVEISRQNGIPQYVQFSNEADMHSFVSLLDGYYRLTEKWTFNLCKDVTTPSLIPLKALKCHGPVGTTFAHKKLLEKANNKDGCYILRESQNYDEYYIDIWTSKENAKKIVVYCFTKEDSNLYTLIRINSQSSFETVQEILAYLGSQLGINLTRCIPPSEYDKASMLLLCSKETKSDRSVITRGDCSCVAQCIPHDAIEYANDAPKFQGKFTIVVQGHLRRSCAEFRTVAVKMLRKETKPTHLHEFLSQIDKILFWQHENIVSTLGMILTNPTALVMEWLPLGTLDVYLNLHRDELQVVDLIEAAFYLAKALWYLEEQHSCHGNIRCNNVLVASHTERSFAVKLSGPGVIAYTDVDLHWIPPECFHNYSKASRSILADVYAFGTTLWEIFSYGAKPNVNLPPKELKEWYLKGEMLPFPTEWHQDIKKVISECWLRDQDNRKRPQAIVRDVNQNLYEVYNSRRSHSYAIIDATAVAAEDEPPVPPQLPQPPLPISRPPLKEPPLSKLKSLFKWAPSVPAKGFSYNSLSQSKSTIDTTNASSGNSTISYLTDDKEPSIAAARSSVSLSDVNEQEPSFQFPEQNSSGYSSWLIEREQLILNGKIGEGFYGEVSKATLNMKGSVNAVVAVKKIKMNHESLIACDKEFKREMDIMKHLCHKNIVRIIGLVEEPERMLVMEYVENGSLLNHLQCSKNMSPDLDYSELLRFSLGVAQGMEYLETQNVIHRDLAARNILVGSDDKIKISDFGLAQVIKDHYYRMTTDRNLPVRWYAIEAIIERKFSHKSDVWSYGIVLWEIFSQGENPQIPDVPDISLHEALHAGQRLQIPDGCPSNVYLLMRKCWDQNSHKRPTFSAIILELDEIKLELCC